VVVVCCLFWVFLFLEVDGAGGDIFMCVYIYIYIYIYSWTRAAWERFTRPVSTIWKI